MKKNNHIFSYSKKEVKRIGKKGKKIKSKIIFHKWILTPQFCGKFIMQMLLIISMLKFIKLNANRNIKIKKCKEFGIKYKDCK